MATKRKRRKAVVIVPQTPAQMGQDVRRDTLKLALKATGLSQVKLAKVLGMDVRTLTRQLKGDSPIDGPAGSIYHLLAYWPQDTLDGLDAELMLGGERVLVRRPK